MSAALNEPRDKLLAEQSGAGFELDHGLGRDLDLLFGLGVDALASFALRGAEGAEADDGDFAALLQGFLDGAEHGGDGGGSLFLGDARFRSDGFYELTFVEVSGFFGSHK